MVLRLFAIMTFLPSPRIILEKPSEISFAVVFLSFISSPITGVSYDRCPQRAVGHGYIQKKSAEVFLRLDLAPIAIDGIGNGLERIERDTDRQNDIRHRYA